MIIRRYRKNDWSSICRVYDRARPDELRGSCDLSAVIPLEQDHKMIKFFQICTIFVASIDRRIVGFAGYRHSYIGWLFVDPEYYRKGIGRVLLKRVLRNVGARAWLRAAKNNNAAISLYLTEGFDIVEEFEGRANGYPCQAVTLALTPELESWKPHFKKIKNLDKTKCH